MEIMKKRLNLSRAVRPTCFAAILAAATLTQVHAADVTWTQTTVDGTFDWSDGANWDTNPNPPATSGDDLTFDVLSAGADIISNVDSAWATSGSVNSLTFAPSSTSGSYTIDTGANTLRIGAGGISNNLTNASPGQVTFQGSLEATANQTWYQASSSWNRGRFYMNADLSGSGDIEITAASGGSIFFQSGNSDSYTGAFTLTSGGARLLDNSQLNRLGSNALTWNSTSSTIISFANLTGADQALTFDTPINFSDTGSGVRSISVDATTSGNSSLAFTGAWTGNLNDNLRFISSSNPDLLLRFQQDGSTLTSTKGNSSQANSALYLSSERYSIENANALGAGNSVSISLGNGGTTSTNAAKTSLYATDGISVASDLFANRNYNGGTNNARSPVVTIGVNDSGASATFSGDLRLEGTSFNANETELNKNRESNVHLTAAIGSTATFSGDIFEFNTSADTRFVPVTVEGGGTVILSGTNSAYQGGTSVIGGTTLSANGGSGASGSATGFGNVQVGYGSASITGDTLSGQSYVTGVSTTNLHVGQTLTGAGIPDGTIITFIHPTIAGRIEISNTATATASGVTLSGSAETGVLGGSGFIKPSVVNGVEQSISVASGSSIAPGNSIGTLTLDGGSTTAAVLTMDAGSAFDFELDASGGTPDQLVFWNYVDGDLVLNNNVLNVTLSGVETPGEYTVSLFEFYSDAGSTIIGSGLTSGLTLNLGEGISSGSLDYNGGTGSIDLTYSVVPEPGSYALLAGCLALSAVMLRRRHA